MKSQNQTPSTDTLKDRTHERLQELILTGDLVPGSKLLETQVAARLDVSRATLREAMIRLSEIGLLVNLPFRGTYIRKLDRVDLQEIYSFRTGLEKMAFQFGWDKRDLISLADLQMRNERLCQTISDNDAFGAIMAELHLHDWCYELSGHSLLLQSWERLKPNLQFYFAMHQKAHDRAGPLRESHDEYIRLAKGDNLDEMLRHLEDHMQQGLQNTQSFLDTTSPG
ncbi:GntR family transcriptional regulator [uncultured Roseovarius sp.]|uniref:GntR family transcriptional regulator n=1 Tax=uncultured Roseovarius sp. TaxID=293344 RepID=UPI00262FAEFF|nr:GntR family transcriptional regulator [uncultured Roseovarius sp.]